MSRRDRRGPAVAARRAVRPRRAAVARAPSSRCWLGVLVDQLVARLGPRSEHRVQPLALVVEVGEVAGVRRRSPGWPGCGRGSGARSRPCPPPAAAARSARAPPSSGRARRWPCRSACRPGRTARPRIMPSPRSCRRRPAVWPGRVASGAPFSASASHRRADRRRRRRRPGGRGSPPAPAALQTRVQPAGGAECFDHDLWLGLGDRPRVLLLGCSGFAAIRGAAGRPASSRCAPAESSSAVARSRSPASSVSIRSSTRSGRPPPADGCARPRPAPRSRGRPAPRRDRAHELRVQQRQVGAGHEDAPAASGERPHAGGDALERPTAGAASATSSAPGSGGSSCPASCTTTTGRAARPRMPVTRRAIVEPCQSSSAFAVPIRVERPPTRTIAPSSGSYRSDGISRRLPAGSVGLDRQDGAHAVFASSPAQHPLVADAAGDALGVHRLQQRLGVAARAAQPVAQLGDRDASRARRRSRPPPRAPAA